MPLEALIAEDEELLRHSLVEQLGRLWPELKLVAECEDGASALEQLAERFLRASAKLEMKRGAS